MKQTTHASSKPETSRNTPDQIQIPPRRKSRRKNLPSSANGASCSLEFVIQASTCPCLKTHPQRRYAALNVYKAIESRGVSGEELERSSKDAWEAQRNQGRLIDRSQQTEVVFHNEQSEQLILRPTQQPTFVGCWVGRTLCCGTLPFVRCCGQHVVQNRRRRLMTGPRRARGRI